MSEPTPWKNWIHDFHSLTSIARAVHADNHKWWHDARGRRLDRNAGELIALCHSELSEALEGVRKGKQDDHVPHRLSEEVEMADCVIRIMDYCEGRGLDLAGAMMDKLLYNQARADHTHEERAKAGGKRF